MSASHHSPLFKSARNRSGQSQRRAEWSGIAYLAQDFVEVQVQQFDKLVDIPQFHGPVRHQGLGAPFGRADRARYVAKGETGVGKLSSKNRK